MGGEVGTAVSVEDADLTVRAEAGIAVGAAGQKVLLRQVHKLAIPKAQMLAKR